MESLAEQIIVDILTQEMQLPADNIWILDQNRKIPNTLDFYVIVGLVDSKTIGVTNSIVPATITPSDPDPPYEGLKEIQTAVVRENIQINLVSKSRDATVRRFEAILALRSVYSVQQQEKNWFKIFRIPQNFLNTSGTEGGSNLNRFSMTVPCHVWYRKEKVLSSPNGDYYDDFKTRVDDEQTIGTEHGIIEFEITPDTPDPSGE